MAKSILQPKGCRTCYACGREIQTEEHHVFFGTANRKLSEKYGLKVRLCFSCHREEKVGVHGGNQELDQKLKQAAQKAFEQKYDHKTFMDIFKRNYI